VKFTEDRFKTLIQHARRCFSAGRNGATDAEQVIEAWMDLEDGIVKDWVAIMVYGIVSDKLTLTQEKSN
jgi:hypothetical protein